MLKNPNFDGELRQLLSLVGIQIETETHERISRFAERELDELALVDTKQLNEEEFTEHSNQLGVLLWLRLLSLQAVRGVLHRFAPDSGSLAPKETISHIFELLQSTVGGLAGDEDWKPQGIANK
jgi:hypothetical protein